jgi:cell division protein FtsW (lipid II flippase)
MKEKDKIDSYKKYYKGLKTSGMKSSVYAQNDIELNNIVELIKKQDKKDEKYLLHNKMIPVLVGLFFITIIMLYNPIKTLVLLTGLSLIFLGLFITLILLFIEYRDISKESYDLSLFSYLGQKKERLKSWRKTPAKYKWTFTIFVTGLILMIFGNRGFVEEIGLEYIFIFIVVYLVVLLSAWIIGERYYQKRHTKNHKPLIDNISNQLVELEETENRD